MSRFLIAFVHNRTSGLELSQEVFKVSDNCSPYDVTVPLNTLNFMFVTADVETAKELTEAFVTLKLGNALVMNCTIPMTPENGGKRYWIGKLTSVGEYQGVYNEHIRALIPELCLGENDEVIDM